MFQCAWCKKEDISPAVWSEHKEPICGQCEFKYRIATEQKMFSGKVADLTKEQRREISAYINNVTRFVEVVRAVKKEKLEGKIKLTSQIIGWTIIVSFFSFFYLGTEGYYPDLGIFSLLYILATLSWAGWCLSKLIYG